MDETGQPGGATPQDGGDEARGQADRPWIGGGWSASEAAWSPPVAGGPDSVQPTWHQAGQPFVSDNWSEASARYADVLSSLSASTAAGDLEHARNGVRRGEWPPGGQQRSEGSESEDHIDSSVDDLSAAARHHSDRHYGDRHHRDPHHSDQHHSDQRPDEAPHEANPVPRFDDDSGDGAGAAPGIPSQRRGPAGDPPTDDSRHDGRHMSRKQPPWATGAGRSVDPPEPGTAADPPGPPPGWHPEPSGERNPAMPSESDRSTPPYDEWRGPGGQPAEWRRPEGHPAGASEEWAGSGGHPAGPSEEPVRHMPEPSNPPPTEQARPDWSSGWTPTWESDHWDAAEHHPDIPAHPDLERRSAGPARPGPGQAAPSTSWPGMAEPGPRAPAPAFRAQEPPAEEPVEVAASTEPAPDTLPQRVPAEPDVPAVPEPPAAEPPAETPELARIATHLRREDPPAPAQERPDGFDVQAILAAVGGVDGVRDAALRTTEDGAHRLRLDLADGADPAEVSRQVARLLQERMGLAAAPQGLPGDRDGEQEVPVPRRHRRSATYRGQAGVAERMTARNPHSDIEAPSRPLPTGERPAPRLIIDHVQVSTFGLDATVEVRLASGDQQAIGLATGPAVDGYVLRLCAAAAASAVDELLRVAGRASRGRCFVENAAIVPFGSCDVAVVVVLLACDGWAEQLSGSALVSGDPRQAVVRATLAAVNRRLTALLA
ncbi:MAG TPA: hypothetical protein VFX60_03440 [Micromonospora sp.]|nr:hypothetical protein [Micromonospora sp.]